MINIFEIAAALHCTERNVRDREGKTLPRCAALNPCRVYLLSEVLWFVDGQERELICRAVGIQPESVRAGIESSLESHGYVPGGSVDEDDPLMH